MVYLIPRMMMSLYLMAHIYLRMVLKRTSLVILGVFNFFKVEEILVTTNKTYFA